MKLQLEGAKQANGHKKPRTSSRQSHAEEFELRAHGSAAFAALSRAAGAPTRHCPPCLKKKETEGRTEGKEGKGNARKEKEMERKEGNGKEGRKLSGLQQ